jgi:hypothetical protein
LLQALLENIPATTRSSRCQIFRVDMPDKVLFLVGVKQPILFPSMAGEG